MILKSQATKKRQFKHFSFSFEQKVAACFLLTIFIVGTIFYAYKKANEELIHTSKWVDHTRNVLFQSERVITQMQDVVIGTRGFLLTGDEQFLQPFDKAVLGITNSMSELKRLTKDNPAQQLRVDSIKYIAAINIETRQKLIGLRKEKGLVTGEILSLLYLARKPLLQLHSLINNIQVEENLLLVKRKNDNERSINNSYKFIISLLAFFVAILMVLFAIIYKNIQSRNKAEKALRKSEALVRSIVNNTITPINIKDLSGRFIMVNKEFANIVQQEQDEIIGKTNHDVMPPEVADAFQTEDNKVFTTKKLVKSELQMPGSDGINTFLTAKFPLFDTEGQMYALCGVATDITPVKKAHELLKKSHDQLNKVLNGLQRLLYTSQDVICIIDEEGKFVQVSETCKDLWGYTSQEIEGKKYIDFVAEEDKAKTEEIAGEIISGSAINDFENRYIRPDGSLIPILWTAIWSEEDKMMYCIARDATEKNRTAKQLAQSQSRLAHAQKIARLGSWEKDIENDVLSCSDEMYHLFGLKKEEVKDRKIAFFKGIYPDDREILLKAKKEALQTGNIIDVEHRIIRPDGTVLYVHTKSEITFNARNKPIWISGTCLDITSRKQSEILLKELNEKLEKRAEELAASNAELERFAYVASHDLQEPLRMVSSFLHLLEKKISAQLDETSKKYIYFAVDGAERMKRLIQDLLQYSRIGTSNEGFAFTDLNKVLNEVMNVLSDTIKQSKAVINLGQLPVVYANKTQMEQLFQNLIGNALKYRGENDPVIEVGCNEKNNKWIFFVKDNGIGIDSKFFEKIFILFQRLHNKSEYSGTGIGLAVCKKIVDRHGGNIWVESKLGSGSTFFFTLNKRINA